MSEYKFKYEKGDVLEDPSYDYYFMIIGKSTDFSLYPNPTPVYNLWFLNNCRGRKYDTWRAKYIDSENQNIYKVRSATKLEKVLYL